MSNNTQAALQPGNIAGVDTRNRIIRSSTSETLADDNGLITDEYHDFHLRLARNGVGLIFTGHCSVHPRGNYIRGMTALDRDDVIPRMKKLTDAIHAAGGKIFAQLNHAGSQSRDESIAPLAPSVVGNPQFHRLPLAAATSEEIWEAIGAFGDAARRVREAGFDGVHVHAGHGYLLSEFLSPATNRREDEWGGSLENRQRLLVETYKSMRAAAGDDFPITNKIGLWDYVENGLSVEEGRATVALMDEHGVDAIELSAGLMSPLAESAARYVGVTRKRALQDKLLHRIFAAPVAEAYYRDEARRHKANARGKTILVGGLRTVELMNEVIADGSTDFVSLARPLIREPDLVRKIEAGKTGMVDCVSCNICLMHEGSEPLKCWRESNRDLAVHALARIRGRV
ncbi:MAG: 2,4-dienoyl-CoA reductase-like NADH-dependent reductase (Old Yellow Enzyme family) [Verrucomicrobiales bacterium]|jgi:2,4-dienoyl-CoA reductase-like NADH-dependent reductase (Old Yellow Enzyme family)